MLSLRRSITCLNELSRELLWGLTRVVRSPMALLLTHWLRRRTEADAGWSAYYIRDFEVARSIAGEFECCEPFSAAGQNNRTWTTRAQTSSARGRARRYQLLSQGTLDLPRLPEALRTRLRATHRRPSQPRQKQTHGSNPKGDRSLIASISALSMISIPSFALGLKAA